MNCEHIGDTVKLWHGDCIEVMRSLSENSIDSIVTDPPYGLEFMGKEWDGADGFRRSLNTADVGRDSVFGRTSAKAPEYRTAGTGVKSRPGIGGRETEWVSNQGWNQFRCQTCGHLSHGGSPCRCEKPQFVRADNRWNLFQEWCRVWATECLRVLKPGGHLLSFGGTRTHHRMMCGIEDAGFEIRDTVMWVYGSGFPKSHNLKGDHEGWGTALKPAWEPIVVARKPLIGTVERNVTTHGTGALNIDGCRVPCEAIHTTRNTALGRMNDDSWQPQAGVFENHPAGRWPANLIHDGSDEVMEVFVSFGDKTSGKKIVGKGKRRDDEPDWRFGEGESSYGDTGTAARFYYCAKASKVDREDGLEELALVPVHRYGEQGQGPQPQQTPRKAVPQKNIHPTVKPHELMRWLCRLVTPPGGLILDPFTGSGSTGKAAVVEGFRFVGIEREADFVAIAAGRIRAKLKSAKKTSPSLFDAEFGG